MSLARRKDSEKAKLHFSSKSFSIKSAQVDKQEIELPLKLNDLLDMSFNLSSRTPIIKNKLSQCSKEGDDKFRPLSKTASETNLNEFKLNINHSRLSLINLPTTDTFKSLPNPQLYEDSEKRWWRRSFQPTKSPEAVKTVSSYIPRNDISIWDTNDLKKYANLQTKDLSDNTAKTKSSSKQIKKLQIILEFFHNEIAFIEVLCTIGQFFYDPIKELNILSECSFNLIFPNLMEFIDIHKTFVHTLIVCIRNKTIESQFVEVLNNQFEGVLHLKYKDIWGLFFEKNVIGRELLRRLRIKDNKVKQCMNSLESDPRLNKCSFNDLMSRIHKHLAEYPLYIERLKENTPPNKPDHNLLKSALEGCKVLLESVNDRIQAGQNYQIMYEKQNIIKKAIKSEKFSALLPQNFDLLTQRFLKFGCLNVYSKNRTVYECDALITSKTFIFFRKSDTEYFLKPIHMFSNDSSYKVSTFIISVSSIIRVYEEELSPNKFCILAKDFNGKEFICRIEADSKQSQQNWIASITKAMNLDEKDEPSALLYTSPTDLSNTVQSDRLSICEGMSIHSLQNLNGSLGPSSPIIVSELAKSESPKIESVNKGKPKFKKIEETDYKKITWNLCHKKMWELIEKVTKPETNKKTGNNIDLITDLIQDLSDYLACEKASLEVKERTRSYSLHSTSSINNFHIKHKKNLQSEISSPNPNFDKIKCNDKLILKSKEKISIREDSNDRI